MDYTRAPLSFRIRKVARYVRLYGPSRTLVKVRGQYHVRTSGSKTPKLRAPGRSDAHVGLIGAGNFAYSHIAYFLDRDFGAVIRGVMDVEPARAASLARRYRAHYATSDAERIIGDRKIDLVYIASNHASHAEYAIRALDAGKTVHIEKPHVVNQDQLDRLCAAMQESRGRVGLGFNRPESPLGIELSRLVRDQDGPLVANWFVAGHEIPEGHWYYAPEEGGRVLGNLCHWTDYSLRLIPDGGRFPVEIHPARADKSDADIAVSYVFADGSIVVITFSAKGHAFEGVREHLSLHRGNLLAVLEDFRELRADIRERRLRTRLRFRDHGQRAAIRRTYLMSDQAGAALTGADVAYVWETGSLFLQTKVALEERRVVRVDAYPAAGNAPRDD